jgi:hypothetical protein
MCFLFTQLNARPKMNRPHQGIKGLKKESRSKKGCQQGGEAKNQSILEKKGLRQGPSGLQKFCFNTL